MSKSKLIIFSSILVFSIALFFIFFNAKNDKDEIAIFLTLSHPALLDTKDGFVEEIEETYGDTYFLKIYNAEGNAQQANAIATNIAQSSNVKTIFAIGTLAAQTIAKKEKEKPIIVAAVSDKSIFIGSSNVCGVTDFIDPKIQLDGLKAIKKSIKNLAILYSPHEPNSSFMAKGIEEEASNRSIATTLVGVFEPQQITQSTLKACKSSDAVLVPLDNQLVAAMPAVTKAAKSQNCIIIASNESPIHQGALMAFAFDYKLLGKTSAKYFASIVSKENTCDQIGINDMEQLKIYLNHKVKEELNISFEYVEPFSFVDLYQEN